MTLFPANAVCLVYTQPRDLKRRHAPAEAAHTFTAQAQDWGFNQFALQNDILDVRNGFLVDDTLVLKVRQLCACTGTGWDEQQHLSCCGQPPPAWQLHSQEVPSSTTPVRISLHGRVLRQAMSTVACSSCAPCAAALPSSSLL